MNIFYIIGVVVAIIVVAGFFWDCTFERTNASTLRERLDVSTAG